MSFYFHGRGEGKKGRGRKNYPIIKGGGKMDLEGRAFRFFTHREEKKGEMISTMCTRGRALGPCLARKKRPAGLIYIREGGRKEKGKKERR